MSLEQSILVLCHWAPHSLSYISFVWLGSYQHHGYSLWYVSTKTNRCLPFFVPSIIHNLTRATYSPNGFHKLSWPGSNRPIFNYCIVLYCIVVKGLPSAYTLRQSHFLRRKWIFYTPKQNLRLYTSFALCPLLAALLTWWSTTIAMLCRGVASWHYIVVFIWESYYTA